MSESNSTFSQIITLTLNPAIDQTFYVNKIGNGSVGKLEQITTIAGGKGINVSKVLSSFGVEVQTITLLGNNNHEYFQSLLPDLELTVIHCDGTIRTNRVISDNKTEIKFNEAGYILDQDQIRMIMRQVCTMVKANQLWVISGSLPPQFPSDTYQKLIEYIHKQGSKAILDTSGEALEKGIEAQPYLIKPNLDELQSYLDNKNLNREQIKFFVQAFVSRGIDNVVISLGDKGCIAGNSDGVFEVNPLEVEAINTVGAGDCMLAGIIYGLNQGMSFETSVKFGNTLAGIMTIKPLGQYPTLEELESYLN